MENVTFSDESLLYIIRHYTTAGVRNLEREIASICRKACEGSGSQRHRGPGGLDGGDHPEYLGIPKFRYGRAEEKDEIGLAIGLAWTEFGGDILGIETVVMPGKGKITITGKLGEVMQESAQAALSYVRSRAAGLNLEPDLPEPDIHVHVPEGAIPKDAFRGITMASSIVSALTRIPVGQRPWP